MNLLRSLMKRWPSFNIGTALKTMNYLGAYELSINICEQYINAKNIQISNSTVKTKAALQFDSTKLDKYILNSASALAADLSDADYGPLDSNKVCIIATTTYPSGGHTESIIRLLDFLDAYEVYYIERQPACESEKIKAIASKAQVSLMKPNASVTTNIKELFHAVASSQAMNIMVFIHPHDAVASAVLGLLKKYRGLNIVYCVHADHLLNLGLSFADKVLVGRTASKDAFAQYLKQPPIVSSVTPMFKRNFNFTAQDIDKERQRLGINRDDYVTLTGCPAYKIFKDPKLPYWALVKRLLNAEPWLKHIFISSLDSGQKKALKDIFKDQQDLLSRLILLDPGPEFPLYIHMADLFIDSFPMGSALTHIDVIKEKKPTIIKINEEDPFLSFQDYLYEGYEYACHTEDEMFDSILHLLHNPVLRQELSQKVYQYSEERYAFERLKKEILSYLE